MDNSQIRSERYQVCDLVIDVDRRCVTRGGNRIRLPKLSFNLLVELVRFGPYLVTNESLLSSVWNGKVVGPETVTQRVKLIRDALGDDSHKPKYIDVVWGEGYRLCCDVVRLADDSEMQVESSKAIGRNRIRLAMSSIAAVSLVLVASFVYLGLSESVESAADGFSPPSSSIAVLPFINVGDEVDEEYFSIGLPDTILHKLANLDDIIVIARTSSFTFNAQNSDARIIGRSLNVRYLLEGSVQRAGKEVRIIAQLIDTLDASHVWSFERRLRMRDIFTVQDELVLEITRALAITLQQSDKERLLAHGTTSVPAYLAYLRGKYASDSESLELQDEALAHFRDAIEHDPEFGRAWLGVASVYKVLTRHGSMDGDEGERQINASIERALSLDDKLGQAYALRAMMISVDDLTETDLDLRKVRKTLLEKAVRLSPNDPVVLAAYANVLCPMMIKDRSCHEKKSAVLKEAIRRDPENPEPYIELGWTHVALNNPHLPGRFFEESVRRNPDYIPGYGAVALWHWGSRNIDWMHSIACLCEALERDPKNDYMRSMLSRIYIDLGMGETASGFINSVDGNNESLQLSKAYSQMKLHLFRKEISTAADMARDNLDDHGGGSLSIIAYGAIVEDALARNELQPAIDQLEELFEKFNVPVEYEDGFMLSRSAVLAAVSLSELHRAAGNLERADELIAGANEYFERENAANSVWRPPNAWAYAIVLLRRGYINDALNELKLVPKAYLRNSWVLSHLSAFEPLRQTAEFKKILVSIQDRIAEQRSVVEKRINTPPPCVADSPGSLIALLL